MSDDTTSDPMAKQPSSKDRSAQPDLINLKAIPTSTAQEVETDVLRPVVFSSDNNFCRFELEPKGFLSPTSSISIGVKPNSDVKKATFPINIGVHSLVSRAVLKTSSGRVLCDTEEFGWLNSYKSAFIDNTTQLERDQYVCGRCVNWAPLYTTPTAATTNFQTDTEAKLMGLQNGKEYGGLKTTMDVFQGLTPRNFSIVSSGRTGLSPTFAIRLYELFPFLKSGNQIPLFMLDNDRIQVELYFTPLTSTDRMSVSKEDEAQVNAQFEIDQNTVEFISDHIFYPGQMDKWASLNKDLTFQYFDYVVSRQTLTASDTPADDNSAVNTRNIGGAGRLVTRVYAGYRPKSVDIADIGVQGQGSIFNRYTAIGLRKEADYTGHLVSNLRYNETQLYPLDVNNIARHYHNLRDAEGRQLYVPRQVYSGGGNILPDGTEGEATSFDYDGRNQKQLQMTQFYQAWRLNRGERVGTKGIELTMNQNKDAGDGKADTEPGLPPGTYTLTAFTEQLRYATLKDGQLEVYWS